MCNCSTTLIEVNSLHRWQLRVDSIFNTEMSTIFASTLTPSEVTCWNGGENTPAAKSLEMAAVDALALGPNHESIPRRLYLRRKRFPAARGVGSRPWLQGACQFWSYSGTHRGMWSSCRGRVEEDGSRQSPPSGSVRVAGVPAERAAKSVWHTEEAGDRYADSAGVQTDLATEMQTASMPPTPLTVPRPQLLNRWQAKGRAPRPLKRPDAV